MTRRLVALVALVLVAGCGDGGRSPSDVTATDPPATGPATSPPTGPAATDPPVSGPPATDPATGPAGVQPDGFTTVTVQITTAAGEVCEVCMWLADDGDERGRGLMGVTDLGRPDGMVFVFPEPTENQFYMLGTPTPLSIAWFAEDGGFVSSTDMAPCTSAAADCPRYGAAGPFDVAIEVFRGDLGAIGIGPGSAVEVLAGTESPECAATP